MKKITFLLVALCAAIFVNAASVTLTMKDYAAASFTSAGGIVVAAEQATGASAPVYNETAFDLRVYANNTLTITSPEAMTSISFGISPKGEFRLASLTSNVGSVAVTGTPDFTAVWSGDATSVTITVGAQADYGTDGNAKAGQLCFTAINITTNGEGGGTVDPEPTADFPIVGAQATYYGTTYSTQENFAIDLYSDLQFDTDGYPTVDGVWASFDLFTTNANSFAGTYTVGEDDVVGNIGTTYSSWTTMVGTDATTSELASGSITIVWVSGNLYNVTYDVTDANSVKHAGTINNVEILAYTEAGEDYTVNNSNAIAHVEASLEVYTSNGNIVVPAEAGQRIEVYNMMGQTLYSGMAQNAETTISGLATQQVLVVRAGNKTAKVVL